LKPWLQGAVINTDSNLRLQYLAGMGLNYNDAGSIARDFRQYRKFPEGLFSGSPPRLRDLQYAMQRQ
jgi:spermidine synthase